MYLFILLPSVFIDLLSVSLSRCVQCLSVRPSDPLARFCAQCGAAAGPLAAHRRPPADGGQVLRLHLSSPHDTEQCPGDSVHLVQC